MGGRTSAAAKNKYNNKAYDHITIIVPKGEKAVIKAAADRLGLSVTQYIRSAVTAKMRLDGSLPESEQEAQGT